MEECTDAFENVSSFQSCVLFLSKRVYSSYIVFFCLRINEAGNKLFLEFLLLWNFSFIFFFFFFFFSNLENRESLNFSRNNRTNYNAYITFFVFTFAFSLKSRMAVINISDGRACT